MKKNKILIGVLIFVIYCLLIANLVTANENTVNSSSSPAKITIEYSYKKDTNTVLATVKSDKELKATKASWKLSDDKKQYTFEFTTNTKYTTNFTDINGNVIPIQINVTQIDTSPAKITVEYSYKKETNTVLATVKSDKELKATKASWKLSADKKQYTFEFTTNTKYTTNFTDINGNIIPVQINVTQVDTSAAKLTVEYSYKQDTNTVLATVKSDKVLKATKASWKLSSDKKQYTFEFTTNTKYTTNFTDINGNVIPIQINVTQINNNIAKITVEYNYKQDTNTVIATVKSDKELKATKASWKLSADKKQYTFEFTTNTKYTTNFTDINGNVIPVLINVTQIDTSPAKLTVEYNYNKGTNRVVATVKSNKELKATKASWKLSADKKQYTFEFTTNTKYTTNFTDINGNVIPVLINVTQIDMTPPEIIVEYEFNNDDTVTVSLKSNEQLKNTKATWNLSSDKLVYKNVFSVSQNYTTSVQDIYGNEAIVKINFKVLKYTYKQSDNSTIKVRYLYKSNTQVLVQIVSSVKMVNTKPTWSLSSDGYTYSKVFDSNNIYVTPIVDVNGVTKNVNIIVNLFSTYLTGIDVSQHQGKINWTDVKNSGIDFAIIRCGYGQNITSQDDTYFARNIAECERLGIPYGVYLYSYALTEQDALSEAQHVLRLIKGHNPTLGVWIDMEDADGYKSRNGMPSNATLVNICDTFCKTIAQNGYKPGVYASLDWLNGSLNSSKLEQYNTWVAQWNTSCSYTKKYVMWQYSSKGSVNGILTNVDMNIYYK